MLKKNAIVKVTATGVIAIMGILGCASENPHFNEAKITKQQAEQIALGKIPQGQIKEAELEQEKGKLVWSFDIIAPGAANSTEIQIDAKTGEVVLIKQEDKK